MSTITVKFFAHVREQVGIDELTLPLANDQTLEQIKQRLCQQDDKFASALGGKVVMACNQVMSHSDAIVKAGDEVAFFPPVTGG